MKTAITISILLVCLNLNLFAQKSQNDFVFTIKTDNPGFTGDSAYLLRLNSQGVNYNVDIDWDDDGVFDTLGVSSSISHQYDSNGVYSIRLRGVFPAIELGYFNNTDASKLISVDQWGNQVWSSGKRMFYYCDSLTTIPTDTPNFSQVTDMTQMFSNCKSFNQALDHWNVSNVRIMLATFAFCTKFNQPLSNWNVSNVRIMSGLFNYCNAFNQPLNNWNVSNVIDMASIFENAQSFNQPIDSWNVSSVTNMRYMFNGAFSFNQPINSWNVSAVTTMYNMFSNARSFNQPLNNWIVSSVTDMTDMFSGALNFNQPLSNWVVSNVTNMRSMFRYCFQFDQSLHHWNFSSVTAMTNFLDSTSMSVTNYDSLLAHLHQSHFNKNLSLGAGGLAYCSSDSLRNLLINNGWSFTGDNYNCQTVGLEENQINRTLSIFPNPSSSHVILSMEKAQGHRLRIFNIQGQLIRELLLSSEQTNVDISELDNGIYFLQGKGVSKKLVVQH